MPFVLRGGPEQASAQLIALLHARGILDEKGNVKAPVEEPRAGPIVEFLRERTGDRCSNGKVAKTAKLTKESPPSSFYFLFGCSSKVEYLYRYLSREARKKNNQQR